jgi:uncharacterized protein (DUF1697 family)
MSRYAAFLRGMNVGGHRLTNKELCEHFARMGFSDVASFRASGNVVFAGEQHAPATVGKEIEAGLEQALGYGVPTFIRTAEQLRTMAAAQPFPAKEVERSKGKLQVAMLRGPAAAKAKKEIMALSSKEDSLAFGACELYWLPSGGILESELDMKLIEKLLGTMTMRTKNTVEQIVGKHFAE